MAEREMSRAAGRPALDRFGVLLEHGTDIISVVDPDGVLHFASPSVQPVLGYHSGELLGRRICELVHPEDLGRVTPALQTRLMQTGALAPIRYRFRHRDGSWRTLESFGSNRLDEPSIRGIVINSREVTDEDARDESARRLAAIVESSSDAIVCASLDGTILSWNRGAEEIYGYSAEEAVGRPSSRIVPEELAADERDLLERITRGETVRNAWATRLRSDGRRISVSLTASPIRSADGRVRAASFITSDVTHRIEVEQAFQEANQRLMRVLCTSPSILYTLQVTETGTVPTWVSDNIERVLGYSNQAATSPGWWVTGLHPEDRPRILREFASLFEVGTVSYEYRFLHGDGEYTWIRDELVLLRDLNGAPVEIVGTWVDVTERKETEQILYESNERFRLAMLATQDVIWDWDLRTNEIVVSESLRSVIGDPHLQLTLTPQWWRKQRHPEDTERVSESVRSAIESGRHTWTDEFRLRRSDGSFATVLNRAYVLRDGDARPLRMIGISSDITERKRVEQELNRAKEAAEAANSAKSNFLSSMSHELRTPLNSVIGFTRILRKNKAGNLQDQELAYLERIQVNGTHLLALINDILDLSKIEAGKVELETGPVAIDDLIRETLDQLGGSAPPDVALRAEIPDEIAPVETDSSRLKQILINLIGNALKFTERGSVVVAVRTDPRTHLPLAVEVRDTGIGIAEDRLEMIFHAFEQADRGTSRRYGGTGLGLPISASLAQMLGCRIHVASEAGSGSVFSLDTSHLRASEEPLEVPDTAAGPQAAAALRAASSAGLLVRNHHEFLRGRRVLIIDDDPDARVLLSEAIGAYGSEIMVAVSGEQGLRMARNFRPNLITLDLMMPGLSGWETLQLLKADPVLCDIPVVVVSMLGQESRNGLARSLDLLTKPVDRTALEVVLRRNLGESHTRVLVVDDDPDARELIVHCLRDAPVEIRLAENGRVALEILPAFVPDLVILDLQMPELDGMGFLERLAETAPEASPAVVVVTNRDLDSAEVDVLRHSTMGIVKKSGNIEEVLRAALNRVGTTLPRESRSVA